MPKRPASTSLEEVLYSRVQRVAKVDRRSLAEVLERCVEVGLPRLEEELKTKLQEEHVPYRGKNDSRPPKKEAKNLAA